MEKLFIKRIRLDFDDSNSETIDIKEIEQSLKVTYPKHNITPLNEMKTISGEYLILAYSIVERKEPRGIRVL